MTSLGAVAPLAEPAVVRSIFASAKIFARRAVLQTPFRHI